VFGNFHFALQSSDVLIALIGRRWISGDLAGPDDQVRLELATALKLNIRVMPILVEEASMPRCDELPDDLKALAVLDTRQISDANFDADYHRLVSVIWGWLGSSLTEQGRVAEAIEAYREALRIDPQSVEEHLNFGRFLERQDRLDEAVEAYREVLRILRERHNIHPFREVDFYIGSQRWRGDTARRIRERVISLQNFIPNWLADRLASADFPNESVQRAVNVPGKPERSPVDCTVFAPDRVRRERTGLLQAFLHAPEAKRKAQKAAKQFDPEATERGYRSLALDAQTGTTFAFDVEIEGFILHERTDTLLWTGQPQAATFRFDVPEDCKLGQHVGIVRISQDGAPVGRITFQIEVVLDAHGGSQRPAGKEARHYHACFCSYSSLDRAEMQKRAQGLRATGLETFIDVLTLRPGDMWNTKIFEAIDESDLFVVIWSTNARDSEWVKKESHYALRHYVEHGSPDFVPIPVEGPPIASVPQDLQAYHFNDELLSQIRAAELEMLARKHLGQSNVTPVTSES
jgi:tetratricopeptide (TPR) repeat protein